MAMITILKLLILWLWFSPMGIKQFKLHLKVVDINSFWPRTSVIIGTNGGLLPGYEKAMAWTRLINHLWDFSSSFEFSISVDWSLNLSKDFLLKCTGLGPWLHECLKRDHLLKCIIFMSLIMSLFLPYFQVSRPYSDKWRC